MKFYVEVTVTPDGPITTIERGFINTEGEADGIEPDTP